MTIGKNIGKVIPMKVSSMEPMMPRVTPEIISLSGAIRERIGGLKEKSMAAYKAGCDTIIIPKDNLKDLTKISDEVKNNVNFVSVSSFDEVAKVALEYMPNKKDSKVIINTNAEAGSSAAVTQ